MKFGWQRGCSRLLECDTLLHFTTIRGIRSQLVSSSYHHCYNHGNKLTLDLLWGTFSISLSRDLELESWNLPIFQIWYWPVNGIVSRFLKIQEIHPWVKNTFLNSWFRNWSHISFLWHFKSHVSYSQIIGWVWARSASTFALHLTWPIQSGSLQVVKPALTMGTTHN